MIDREAWMGELVEKLLEAFGARLLFVGLQGSYRRGEATQASDLDAVVVVETLALEDLLRYRNIVQTLPLPEKACGFICGRRELAFWPKYELFQLERETDAYHGRLADWLPPVGEADIRQSVHIGAAALYHQLAHAYVHDDAAARRETLRAARKTVFFLLQVQYYLESGFYAPTRTVLLDRLGADARARLLEDCGDIDFAYNRLLDWCGQTLEQEGKSA